MKKVPFIAGILVLALVLASGIGCASAEKNKEVDSVSKASVAGKEMPDIRNSIVPVDDQVSTIVVYYSQGSATKRVAEDLASIFSADIEKIVESKQRGTGFFQFMTTGYQSTFRMASAIEAPVYNPALYGRAIVLTPVWSWSLSPPVRAWLRLMRGKLPKSAFITVAGDTKPDTIVAMMTKESSTIPVAFAGFGDKDFLSENHVLYIDKMTRIVDSLR
jgi:hypothetical protein